jgi:hypothetical protein
MPYDWKTELPGILARHADTCPRNRGGVCSCGPLGYRASVTDPQTGREVLSPDFESVAEAQTWQREQEQAIGAPVGDFTVAAQAQAWLRDQPASREAAVPVESGDLGAVVEEFLQAAENGGVEDGSGKRYSPDGLRKLRGALSHAAAELGAMNIEDVGRRHIQSLVERLQQSGLSAGRVDAVVEGLRALFSYAVERDLVATNAAAEVTSPGTLSSSNGGGSLPAQPATVPDASPGAGPPLAGSEPARPPTPKARRSPSSASRRRPRAGLTLEAVILKFLRAADEGSIDRRPGEPYTFETLLDLRGAMSYVDERLRTMELGDIRRRHVQKLVDDLRSVGLPPGVVAVVVDSLRALYAFAIQRNLVDFSPVVELSMPLHDDGPSEDTATWSQLPAAPSPPPPTAAPPPPTQPAPAQPSYPQLQQPPDYYGSEVRQALAPTGAMLALGGRVVTWATRLALAAFVLLVLVLARELGLFELVR